MEIKGYTLINDEKVDRAINGWIDKNGDLSGGVGEDASDEVKLAAYDRIGGLIRNKNGDKVKNGCFCDYKESKKVNKPVPYENPKVILEFNVQKIVKKNIAREVVEVPENEELPMEIQVERKAQEQIKEREGKVVKGKED